MKYISFIRYGLIAISAIVVVLFLATMNEAAGTFPYIDLLLRWTYVMLAVAIGVVVVLPILGMAKNPKGTGRTMIGVAIVFVVIAISYALADGTTIVTPAKTYDNVLELKVSDTGLYATYIALAGAVGAIVVGELVKLFRK